jgi:hypothetical protein
MEQYNILLALEVKTKNLKLCYWPESYAVVNFVSFWYVMHYKWLNNLHLSDVNKTSI